MPSTNSRGPTTEYTAPSYLDPDGRKLGWFLEAQQEGQAWLDAQKPAQGWEGALSMLSEPEGISSSTTDGLSSVGYNKGKRIARELVASMADFKHEGEYGVTWNNELYDQAHTLTNLDKNWYKKTFANAVYRQAIQYAVATGTAYLYETWDPHFHSPYRGDIRLQACSPADVSFVQMPKDHDIQRAYCVIVREELPINLARAIYAPQNPSFAASLQPDRDQPGWLARGLRKVQQFVSPALRVAGRLSQENSSSFPTVDIFHMYVLDSSINNGGLPVTLGPRGTNWSYTVPTLGDPITTDQVNPATGNFFTRPATHDECRLFPMRRYVIYSRTGVAYDGPSPWWHGQAPIARLRFNDWAWEALGSSLVGEVRTMQKGIVELMRNIEDSAAARLDPPYVYDDTLVASSWAKQFNPRMAGARAAGPINQGKLIEFPVDPSAYDVPSWIPQWIESQEARMDYLTGVKDMVAIAKAQQIPAADTLEKLMEMAGPIVRDLVGQIAEPLTRLGEWRKSLYFQFYTRARMLTVTGPEGVDINVQYLPEQLKILQPNVKPEYRIGQIQRSLDDFEYMVTESGISEIHRMSTKLLFIQLMKVGFPIDWWTMADLLKIPNFGPPPKGTNTVMERWVAQKNMEIDLAVEQQAEGARRMAELGLAGPGGGAPGEGEGGEGSEEGTEGGAKPGAPGAAHAGGRPPSFQAPPRLASKDGGTRSTIETSR